MKLLAHSSVYLGASIVNAAIPFILLPLYTRVLAPADLAQIALVEMAVAFALPLISAGSHGAVNVEYFKLDRPTFRRYVASALVLPSGAAILLAVCIAAFAYWRPEVGGMRIRVFLAVPIIVFGQALMQMALVLYQASQRPFHYGLVQVTYSALNLGLSVILIVWADQGWEGRLNALLISGIFAGAISLLILQREKFIAWSISSSLVRSAAVFGFPLIPHALAMLVIVYSDRFFITKFLGLGALGIYVVGQQIGMSISMLQNAFTQAWTPFLFANLAAGDDASKSRLVRSSYLFSLFLLGSVGVLYAVTPLIFDIFIARQYHGAKDVTVLIGLGFAVTGMYKMAVGYIFYERKTYLLSAIAVVNVCVSVSLNYFLVPLFGVMGAAYSLVFSMFTVFLIAWFVAARIHPMPWLRAWRVTR
jgi:O-antigen/teichoic acid export membrane protein